MAREKSLHDQSSPRPRSARRRVPLRLSSMSKQQSRTESRRPDPSASCARRRRIWHGPFRLALSPNSDRRLSPSGAVVQSSTAWKNRNGNTAQSRAFRAFDASQRKHWSMSHLFERWALERSGVFSLERSSVRNSWGQLGIRSLWDGVAEAIKFAD